MGEETYEVFESTEDNQYDESQSEYADYANQYPNQVNQSEFGDQSQSEHVNDVKQGEYGTKKAIFNLNLGEFTVDEDATLN